MFGIPANWWHLIQKSFGLCELVANKGQPNGYAGLDGSAKLPVANLPALAIVDTYVVASEAAMLALVAQKGDLAIRSDLSKTFVLAADNPAVLANWIWMQTPPSAVSSVNGKTGVVVLAAADVGADPSGAAAAAVAGLRWQLWARV